MEFVGDFMRFLIDEKIYTLRGGACGPGFWVGLVHREDVDRCIQWLNDHCDDPKYPPQF